MADAWEHHTWNGSHYFWVDEMEVNEDRFEAKASVITAILDAKGNIQYTVLAVTLPQKLINSESCSKQSSMCSEVLSH